MFKRFIFIILLLSMNYLKGSEFEIKIAYYPKEVIQGEPCNVTVIIRNISGKEIIVGGGFNGLNKEFIVKRADGKARKEIIPKLTRTFAKEVEAKAFLSDFKSDFTEDIFKRYHDEVGEFIVRFRLSSFFSEAWIGAIYKGKKVKTWSGEAYSEEVHIYLKEPTGIDKEAYDYFEGHPLWKTKELIEKYPASTYSGWALYNYRSDIPGAFVKNESAEKSILAAINRDSIGLKKWWQLNILSIPDERERNRIEEMKMLADKTELFVNSHPEFLYSGYLLARAGINALGLGEFQRSCQMLSQSLKMPWGIAESQQKDLKPHKDGTEWVLTYLKDKGICK